VVLFRDFIPSKQLRALPEEEESELQLRNASKSGVFFNILSLISSQLDSRLISTSSSGDAILSRAFNGTRPVIDICDIVRAGNGTYFET